MKARDIIPDWPRRGSTSKPYGVSVPPGRGMLGLVESIDRYNRHCYEVETAALEEAARRLNFELNCVGLMLPGISDSYYRRHLWEEKTYRTTRPIICCDGEPL